MHPRPKYFPLEKNTNVIYGWSGVSEITPEAILLLPVTSCFMPLLGMVFLGPTAQERPPPSSPSYLLYLWHSHTFDIIHWTVTRQKRLKLSEHVHNKCTDAASPGVCWLSHQIVLVHDGHSQQQLIPSRQEDMQLTGWWRVQRARLATTSEEKVQPAFASHKQPVTVFKSMKITFLPYKS